MIALPHSMLLPSLNSSGGGQPAFGPRPTPVVRPYASVLQFGPMADVDFSPTVTTDAAMGLDMDSYGNLWRLGMQGIEKVGQLNALGQYRMQNGMAGDIFESRNPAMEGHLEIDLSNQNHPFIQTLRARERQRAWHGSEAPGLRAYFNRLGLTGKGVQIGVIDPFDPVDDVQANPANPAMAAASGMGGWDVSDHSKASAALVNDARWGLAPQAQVLQLGFIPRDNAEGTDIDDISTVVANFGKTACNIFDDVTQQIGRAIQMKKQGTSPNLRVLNLTWGSNYISMLDDLSQDMNLQKENGDYYYPRARQQILGPAVNQGLPQQQQVLLNFIHQMYQRPPVSQSYQRYVEATRQAALNGLTILVAVGNEHYQINPGVIAPPDSEFDVLAKSPYVISVAASDTHETPNYRLDDSIAPFSSRGDNRQFNPTITAPGSNIPLSTTYETLSGNLVESGTSFAVPYIAGVIALMLQANPRLTFWQIKSILQRTATPLPNYTVADQGAGVVNPEYAVQAALAPSFPFQTPIAARL